jgi:hypothetical protein
MSFAAPAIYDTKIYSRHSLFQSGLAVNSRDICTSFGKLFNLVSATAFEELESASTLNRDKLGL